MLRAIKETSYLTTNRADATFVVHLLKACFRFQL